MVEDLELGVRLNTDQAVRDLENDLDDLEADVDVSGQQGGAVSGGGGGPGGEIAAGLGVEAGSDLATGGKKGGILGGIAGGLSKTVVLLSSVVAFLALLEPIQQAIGFLVRQFELLVVPFIASLRPLLRVVQKAVVRILDFLRNPSSLLSAIKKGLAPFANAVVGALNNIPGVNISPVSVSQGGGTGKEFRATAQGQGANNNALETLAESPFGGAALGGSSAAFLLLSDDAKQEKDQNQSNGFLGNLGS